MSKAVVNLILPVIKKAIEEVLETYPHHPDQLAKKLRQYFKSMQNINQKLAAN